MLAREDPNFRSLDLYLAASLRAVSRSLNPIRRLFPLDDTMDGMLMTHFPVAFMRCGMNLVGFDMSAHFRKERVLSQNPFDFN